MPHRLPRTCTDHRPLAARRLRRARGWAGLAWLLAIAALLMPVAAAAAESDFPVPRPGSEPEDVAQAATLPAAEQPLPVPATGPVPVRILPQAFAPERVIQRFRLGPKVTEFMVVLHAPSLEGVRLRTPAGQLISADNIWRVGRWQTGQQLSVISLDWSAAGEWMVLAPAQVPVDVIVDPMLVPVTTPDTAEVGRPTVLRWQVQAAGRALDLGSVAELVVASARVVDERGGITDLAYTFEANGVVSLTVPAQAAGVVTVETDIWLSTFGQHVMHRLAVVPEPSVQVLGRRAAPMLIVRVPDAGLDTKATRAVLDVRSSEGARQVIVGRRELDGSFRLQLPAGALGDDPARARVVLGVDGMTRGRQPWHAPSRIVSLGAQGIAATQVVATGSDAGTDEDGKSAGRTATGVGDGHGEASPAAGNAGHGGADASAAHGALDGLLARLLHPATHGPEPWQYGALAAANLVLVVLLWLRHRRRARAAMAAAAAATTSGAATAAAPARPLGRATASGRPAGDIGAGMGVTPEPAGAGPSVRNAAAAGMAMTAAPASRGGPDEAVYDDRTSSLGMGVGGMGGGGMGEGDADNDTAAAPADVENLLEGLDIESLDDLANLAESQAEARTRPRSADTGRDPGADPDADPDVDAAA